LIRKAGRVVVVAADEIDWIDGVGNYARIHAGPESYLLRTTLSGLEARLDPRRFFRIHRSTIVNADRVRELRARRSGEYTVVLREGALLTLSRSRRGKLAEFEGGAARVVSTRAARVVHGRSVETE
jgi:two-component system LytT family response regulator